MYVSPTSTLFIFFYTTGFDIAEISRLDTVSYLYSNYIYIQFWLMLNAILEINHVIY